MKYNKAIDKFRSSFSTRIYWHLRVCFVLTDGFPYNVDVYLDCLIISTGKLQICTFGLTNFGCFCFFFVSFFLSMLHVDAYISQSVVIKIAGEWWCIYWAAAILPTMTPIRLAWAFMMSTSIQHSCLRLPSKYKFLCSGKSPKFAQKIPVEGNSFPRLRAQGSTRFWRRALDLLLSHCRKLLKSKKLPTNIVRKKRVAKE